MLPLSVKIGYGFGHVLNDCCSVLWFAYLITFLTEVLQFGSEWAGALYLLGQVVDGVATPLVGYEAGHLPIGGLFGYGRRKSIHLVGSILTMISFVLIFNQCFPCITPHVSSSLTTFENVSIFVYFAPLVAAFQIGWAMVQISHFSLIPCLTQDSRELTTLNTIRYGASVASNMLSLGILLGFFWLFDETSSCMMPVGLSSMLNDTAPCPAPTPAVLFKPKDLRSFAYTAYIIVGFGLVSNSIFHFLVSEPITSPPASTAAHNGPVSIKWFDWFKKPQLYLIAVVYLLTRLFLNIFQVYFPLFVQTLNLKENDVILGVMVFFLCSGAAVWIVKLCITQIDRLKEEVVSSSPHRPIGPLVTFLCGSVVVVTTSLLSYFLMPKKASSSSGWVFLVAGCSGLGGSFAFISISTIISSFIGRFGDSGGAIVYGFVSFADKLASGGAGLLIQDISATNESEMIKEHPHFIRTVVTFIPAFAMVLASVFVALIKTPVDFDRRPSSVSDDDDVTLEHDSMTDFLPSHDDNSILI